jgi:hypothetical protein
MSSSRCGAEHDILDLTGSASSYDFGTTSIEKVAQSFQVTGGTQRISGITFGFKYEGTNTDDCRISIQTDSSGDPSGTDVWYDTIEGDSGFSGSINFLTLWLLHQAAAPTNGTWPDDMPELTGSTTYWLVFERTGTDSDTDYYSVQRTTGAYSGGTMKSYSGASWSEVTGYDLRFKVHGPPHWIVATGEFATSDNKEPIEIRFAQYDGTTATNLPDYFFRAFVYMDGTIQNEGSGNNWWVHAPELNTTSCVTTAMKSCLYFPTPNWDPAWFISMRGSSGDTVYCEGASITVVELDPDYFQYGVDYVYGRDWNSAAGCNTYRLYGRSDTSLYWSWMNVSGLIIDAGTSADDWLITHGVGLRVNDNAVQYEARSFNVPVRDTNIPFNAPCTVSGIGQGLQTTTRASTGSGSDFDNSCPDTDLIEGPGYDNDTEWIAQRIRINGGASPTNHHSFETGNDQSYGLGSTTAGYQVAQQFTLATDTWFDCISFYGYNNAGSNSGRVNWSISWEQDPSDPNNVDGGSIYQHTGSSVWDFMPTTSGTADWFHCPVGTGGPVFLPAGSYWMFLTAGGATSGSPYAYVYANASGGYTGGTGWWKETSGGSYVDTNDDFNFIIWSGKAQIAEDIATFGLIRDTALTSGEYVTMHLQGDSSGSPDGTDLLTVEEYVPSTTSENYNYLGWTIGLTSGAGSALLVAETDYWVVLKPSYTPSATVHHWIWMFDTSGNYEVSYPYGYKTYNGTTWSSTQTGYFGVTFLSGTGAGPVISREGEDAGTLNFDVYLNTFVEIWPSAAGKRFYGIQYRTDAAGGTTESIRSREYFAINLSKFDNYTFGYPNPPASSSYSNITDFLGVHTRDLFIPSASTPVLGLGMTIWDMDAAGNHAGSLSLQDTFDNLAQTEQCNIEYHPPRDRFYTRVLDEWNTTSGPAAADEWGTSIDLNTSTSTVTHIAQSFTTPSTTSLSASGNLEVQIRSKREGFPDNNLIVEIWTDSSDEPGSMVSGASWTRAGDGNLFYTWLDLSGSSGNVSLSASTTYWIVVYTNATESDKNYYRIGRDYGLQRNEDYTAYGLCKLSTDEASTWSAAQDYSIPFWMGTHGGPNQRLWIPGTSEIEDTWDVTDQIPSYASGSRASVPTNPYGGYLYQDPETTTPTIDFGSVCLISLTVPVAPAVGGPRPTVINQARHRASFW